MIQIKLSFWFLFFLLNSNNYLQSQSLETNIWYSISNAGNTFHSASSGHSLDWVIGQVLIETYKNTNEDIQITQGYLQPFPIITTSVEVDYLNHEISIFPNPTSTGLKVTINDEISHDFEFEIKDIIGNTIIKRSIINDKNGYIDLINLSSGTYILMLSNYKLAIFSSYKIVKI